MVIIVCKGRASQKYRASLNEFLQMALGHDSISSKKINKTHFYSATGYSKKRAIRQSDHPAIKSYLI
ncbi:hypothetical protein EFY79_13030 [Hanamia caeni]|uniref:Uncharacterized protein n=1 Tax=Hanamia caeni TaxID=2294116 RepID=A0A3M9NBP6_9BACT|nr:hypothetical protein EFY79_13030 [Hanamia caeni]